APAPTAAPVPLSEVHPAPAISDAPITMDINFVVMASSGAAHVPASGRVAPSRDRTLRASGVPIVAHRGPAEAGPGCARYRGHSPGISDRGSGPALAADPPDLADCGLQVHEPGAPRSMSGVRPDLGRPVALPLIPLLPPNSPRCL